MPTSIVAGLREHQTRQNTRRDLAGDRWVDLGFVFATPQGKPLDGTAISKQFHHHLERAWAGSAALPRSSPLMRYLATGPRRFSPRSYGGARSLPDWLDQFPRDT